MKKSRFYLDNNINHIPFILHVTFNKISVISVLRGASTIIYAFSSTSEQNIEANAKNATICKKN
jgi:hypothetical protein